jgi:hypothetical protein
MKVWEEEEKDVMWVRAFVDIRHYSLHTDWCILNCLFYTRMK